VYNRLARDSFILIQPAPNVLGGEVYRLTAKGKEQGLKVVAGEYSYSIEGPACQRIFAGITGLKKLTERSYEAEYTWKYDSVTPFGRDSLPKWQVLVERTAYRQG